MITFRALTFQLDRVDRRQERATDERKRKVDADENLLFRHDPLVWRSASERKRLVAYWAMLRENGLLREEQRDER